MRRILIADNEFIIRKGVWDCLLEHGFTQLYEAKNGLEALRLFQEVLPEIVIMDVSMPGMSGLDAYARMREKRNHVQGIFISAYTKPEYLQKALRNEAVDYIFKPLDPLALLQAVKRAEERLHRLGIPDISTIVPENRDEAARILAGKMRAYIAANYARPITVAMIAEAAHLSSTYACTLFKKCTGDTLLNCLTAMRLEEAKKLLKTTQLPAYVIANRVGYQDYRYFKQVFLKKYGILATEYREVPPNG